MTSVELAAARAQAAAAAARLRLPLRSRTWRGQAGEFAGSGTGSSLDFQDHRSYMPGDDPRHINWQAYARTGNYTMKLFREEVRPVVDLVFDASDSLFFEETKARRTAELLQFIVASSAAAGASIRIHALRGELCLPLDAAIVATGAWFDVLHSPAPAHPSAPPDVTKVPVRSGAIRVFLSDLLFPGDPEPVLRHLSQRHGTIIILAPFLRAESDPAWEGNYEFIDAELATHHPHRIDPPILRRYLAAYASHFALWQQSANRHQAVLARISCEDDLITTLFREALPVKALETIHG